MKKVYWKPRQVSRSILLLITILSVSGLYILEKYRIKIEQPFYEDKVKSARVALQAMRMIKIFNQKRDKKIDLEFDPMESTIIGEYMTSVTSNSGDLTAKQTSINPNFAALIVHMLKKAEVKEGDTIAVAASGSFPAINISVYAALEVLKLKPIIISSASASQWGANDPDFLWIDMEKYLHDTHIFSFKSVAASLGGIEDRGLGMSQKGRDLILNGIKRNALVILEANSFNESIDKRVEYYKLMAMGSPIKVFINIGGGTISVGTKVGKKLFSPGLNTKVPDGEQVDSVMMRFITSGVAVIHLSEINSLAKKNGFPTQPKVMPIVGQGKVFIKEEYNIPLAIFIFIILLASLYIFLRTEYGILILTYESNSKKRNIEPTL